MRVLATIAALGTLGVVAALFLARPANAAVTVTDCANDSQLRTAISTEDLVTFACGTATIQVGALGSYVTSRDTTIDGGGTITIDAHNASRIFKVNPGHTLTLTNISLINGRRFAAPEDFGAGVWVLGTLVVDNVTFANNEATQLGGAIFNKGSLSVANSTFRQNTADYGGAIFSDPSTTIRASTFQSNTATVNGGAYATNGVLTAEGGTFLGNSARGVGGAINAVTGITVNGGTYLSNTVVGGAGQLGGAIYTQGRATISGATFTGNQGRTAGGAIHGQTVVVSASTFTGNRAPNERGGGIFATAEVTTTGSSFSGNNAGTQGGAIFSGASMWVTGGTFTGNSANVGGAINTSQSAVITAATFVSNFVSSGGGAIAVDRDLRVVNSVISSNRSSGSGGAVLQQQGDTLVFASGFDNNQAPTVGGSGGAIAVITPTRVTVSGSDFTQNRAGVEGGAVWLGSAAVNGSIFNSRFLTNSAQTAGGAIQAKIAQLLVQDSLLSGNVAFGGGGAIHGIKLLTTRSTLAQNQGVFGAALYADLLEIENSTFSSNLVTASGRGTIETTGVATGSIAVRTSTLFANNGGVVIRSLAVPTTIRDSIVTGAGVGTFCSGMAITQDGRNIIGDGSCGGPPFSGADPLLGPLTDNGGQTPTRALLPGSPAIGQAFYCSPGSSDQRFFLRVSPCDIGAYESGMAPTITSLLPASAQAGGAAFALTIQGTGFIPATVALWNGSVRPTTVVNGTTLTVQISAADIATAGTAEVRARYGAATDSESNALPITIAPPAVLVPAVFVNRPLE